MAIARPDNTNNRWGKRLWQKALSEMIYNSIAKKGKAKSAKFKPNRFKRNNLVIIMVKIIVKKINKIDAIFNNVIHIFYHKKYKKEEEIRSFVLHFTKIGV